VAGAGVTCAAMLAGCTTHDASNGGSTPATSGTATSAGGSALAAGALAATSQVPDGGGKIIDGKNIVITEPQSGSFKAFSAICTHDGWLVFVYEDAAGARIGPIAGLERWPVRTGGCAI